MGFEVNPVAQEIAANTLLFLKGLGALLLLLTAASLVWRFRNY